MTGGRDGASDDQGDPLTNHGVVQRLGCGTERVLAEVGLGGANGK